MKKRKVAFVIVFSIVTFGIYFLYWFYCTSKDVLAENKSRGSALLWLLGLIVPFLNLYILYRFLDENGKLLGFSGLIYWLVWVFTFGIGAIVLTGVIQNKINVKFSEAVPAIVKEPKAEKKQEIKLEKKTRKGPAVYEF